ncbi:TIGR02710 family CRISPR-associated CARF protein [Desulfosporosinus sp. BICA1-9]|uniref:TIGR02710 family CRISPR-associated CARF protein n=1 Tax=Desulfosporosinus sp. BICA1-9 TaxID=1531958 RepID=UPI00054C4558|nr:TIGR02710 family CRISPR-associated CARF protein [Desulfosporosinus sp. BICA1-9]KJS47034.1 MAG: hypothetical protein VR66_22025 [Peptococcaceae bacterium BRH_c23]KJS87120.1 MAG: hypothetical protein JL57_14880 [Desulfosporosinus sp. BICA1-9]HBW37360.1 TIGR02710 family CRISPR-associated protein [Desulfosporosinus sp.]
MKKVLVMTVGSSIEPLIFSITQHKPDFVYFICSEGSKNCVDGVGTVLTDKRNNRSYRSVVAELNLKADQYAIGSIVDQDDFNDCYMGARKTLNLCQSNFPEVRGYIDYTGGTKSMCAGIVAAMLDHGEFEIGIVSGEKNDLIGVTPGTERIRRMDLSNIEFQRKLANMEKLFLQYDYAAAYLLANELSFLQVGSEQQDVITYWTTSCRGFNNWDSFQYEIALTQLNIHAKKFHKSIRVLKEIISETEQFKRVDKLGQAAEKVGFALVYDLIYNAQRRAMQQRYDDAVSRLYRATELVGQITLTHHSPPLSSGNLNWRALPDHLQTIYGLSVFDLSKEENLNTDEMQKGNSGTVNLGLMKTIDLLENLDIKGSGAVFREFKKKILAQIKHRNGSFLAHGSDPIQREEFNSFSKLVWDYTVAIEKQFNTKTSWSELFAQLPNQL